MQYDVLQVCKNGHKITDCYDIRPEDRKNFCPDCGEPTLTKCPSCEIPIQGAKIKSHQSLVDARFGRHVMLREKPADVPNYCKDCGEPFPWTSKKIQTAIQILTEFGELDEQEKKTIEQDVENIAKDVPEAELSARRIKRIWERTKSVGYEVIMEFASRTAAKILKGPP